MFSNPRYLAAPVGLALFLVAGLTALAAEPAKDAKEITNSIGMKLAPIPAGKFLMGSPKEDKERRSDETPHEVEITKPFYLGVHVVTQAEYQRIMDKNPSHFCAQGEGKDKVAGMDTSRFPVENVSWKDAVEFCRKLSELPEEKAARRVYRLPTEAEWEYACRAGKTTIFHHGDSLSSKQANFDGNFPYGEAEKGPYLERTTKVGSYQPNAFGLYDMHGNVWQWCQDWYDLLYYKNNPPKQDPPGPAKGMERVLRSGSWYHDGQYCRSADRRGLQPGARSAYYGFRVAAVQSGK